MFDIDPEEEHAKHFAQFQAELKKFNAQLFENIEGKMKPLQSYYTIEKEKGEKYIHIEPDAPGEVQTLLQKLIKTFLTPPFH